MRKLLRRTFSVAFLAGVMVLLMTATALATSCPPVNKPVGAGQGGTATLDVVTETFTITSVDLNAAGMMKGNFVTVSVVAGGTLLDQVVTFGRKDLPEGAHNAGPATTSVTALESTMHPSVPDLTERAGKGSPCIWGPFSAF